MRWAHQESNLAPPDYELGGVYNNEKLLIL